MWHPSVPSYMNPYNFLEIKYPEGLDVTMSTIYFILNPSFNILCNKKNEIVTNSDKKLAFEYFRVKTISGKIYASY